MILTVMRGSQRMAICRWMKLRKTTIEVYLVNNNSCQINHVISVILLLRTCSTGDLAEWLTRRRLIAYFTNWSCWSSQIYKMLDQIHVSRDSEVRIFQSSNFFAAFCSDLQAIKIISVFMLKTNYLTPTECCRLPSCS